jgi:hypothetical protein
MEFCYGFKGLGPDLVFGGDSAEDLPAGDDIQNCLSF